MKIPGPSTIQKIAKQVGDDCIRIRRDLHSYPEPGWCEYRSTSAILDSLDHLPLKLSWGRSLFGDVDRLGLPSSEVSSRFLASAEGDIGGQRLHEMRAGSTGLVAEIRGSNPGRTVALRCDMDALPILESRDAGHPASAGGYASCYHGYMHACGHDAHVAIGIGVLRLFAELDGQFGGALRVIFQPAEEGTRGAQSFVDAGWLDDVDTLVAFHMDGEMGASTGVFVPGVSGLLATEKWEVSVGGRSAHFASSPQLGRNALEGGAAIALLSQLITTEPGQREFVNVGVLNAGTSHNIVPSEAKLSIELRTEADDRMVDLKSRVRRLVSGLGYGLDLATDVRIVGRSPSADSSEGLRESLRASIGKMGYDSQPSRAFRASDDAAVMMRHVQGLGGDATYALVGSAGSQSPHTPDFSVDDGAIVPAIEVLAHALMVQLDGQ